MPNDYARINYLLERFNENDCSPRELRELITEIQFVEDQSLLDPALLAIWKQSQTSLHIPVSTRESIYQNIIKTSGKAQAKGFIKLKWARVAAALLILAGAGGWLWHVNTRAVPQIAKVEIPVPSAPAVIVPGGNKATLTLADGTVITLDSAKNGAVAQQGSMRIIKSANGLLAYTNDNVKGPQSPKGSSGSLHSGYNTVTTPRGGQYQVILPDGSKVWLNASSSVSFPAIFSSGKRAVEVTGEAYFEIAMDNQRPFTVKAGEVLVDVLGTKFNINSYTDEDQMQTTLLEGSVKVSNKSSGALLKPGQVARIKYEAESALKITDDPSAVNNIAWVNGFFHFEKADIHTVMRQLARWYDIEVEFRKGGNAQLDRFGGDIQRNLPLSAVLKILESSQVHFKIENKKLIVMP